MRVRGLVNQIGYLEPSHLTFLKQLNRAFVSRFMTIILINVNLIRSVAVKAVYSVFVIKRFNIFELITSTNS